MSFTEQYIKESADLLKEIQINEIELAVDILASVRNSGGRLFLIGSGGGAGHASHATCDFRKLCDFEAYSPYDNVSELTARVNDEGWETTISNWLKTSKLSSNDCLLVFSVGGGSDEKEISTNLINAIKFAREKGAKVVGIVGKDGGYTKNTGDAVILIPVVNKSRITPHTEGYQAVIWHLIVSHPKLQVNSAKWESSDKQT